MAGSNAAIPGTGSARMSNAPAMPKGGNLSAAPGRSSMANMDGAGPVVLKFQGWPEVGHMAVTVQSDLHRATDAALKTLQEDMVAWAQENAPWEDVTGDARAELHSPSIAVLPNGDRIVTLAHGVDYGVHLETRDGGRLGIIARAIDEFASQVTSRIGAEVGR